MLAHGSVLEKEFSEVRQVVAIAKDFQMADLQPSEIAMMDFGEKVVRDASAVTQADIDGLRRHELSDVEIFDIATAAAARCFFSKTLDALGALPDEGYRELDEELRRELTVGRPISGGEAIS